MSLLAPLFLLGGLAIGLPILFHLIRQQPKASVSFSSLMFLRPTPPTLTRRSRLDNWPLLLLRATALLLLAAAFARPFLRSTSLADADTMYRRTVLVIDTSASLQRPGVWTDATQRALQAIESLEPGTELSIVAFDQRTELLFGFEQSHTLALPQLKAAATSIIKELTPSWRATQLGSALKRSAELASEVDESQETNGRQLHSSIVLITDLQSGSEIESLQSFPWPKNVPVDIQIARGDTNSNAWAQILPTMVEETDAGNDRVRLRVSNSPKAATSQFRVAWQSSDLQAASELPVQVPPGESRVVSMSKPTSEVTSLVLKNDENAFDNQRFLVAPEPKTLKVLFVGNDARSYPPRESLLYYLMRVPFSDSLRTVSVEQSEKVEATLLNPETTPLVIVTKAIDSAGSKLLRQYAASGGRVLCVLGDAETDWNGALKAILADDSIAVSEANVDDYAMLSNIEFDSSLFESMADPQFNDFSKIRFWSHRRLDPLPEKVRRLANFDDGDVAIAEEAIGTGGIWILTTGWQPDASQLALSTKFLPLMFGFFDSRSHLLSPLASSIVGDPVDWKPSKTARIIGPDGTEFAFAELSDLESMDRPGIYQYTDGTTVERIAVNLAESESRVDPLDPASLERFGIPLGKADTIEASQANARQKRDVELENNQKLWRWFAFAALGFLAAETMWGAFPKRELRQ
ncbi:hypothetical protein CA13_68850 [Planctomycetes bacterium CA13]|uniref:VWFA domain-containing protein n=1 Tax=Novipirellula herctigrandis TaxID=2527986 RepID=A0A5C5YN83_9BACT|nr:hypothetical protein CA13_68850 [Planctomycetes bacterium CA13]